jgi:hypothetical protein
MMTLPLLATLALMIGLQLAVTPGSGQVVLVASSTNTLGAGIREARLSGAPINDSYDRQAGTKFARCSRRGTGEPDLVLDVRAPGQVKVGSDLTYRARVTNCGGPMVGFGVTLQYLFSSPIDFQLDESSPNCYSPEPGSVICDLSTVAPGETLKVHVVVRPTTAGTLVNTAEVFHGDDPTPENNRDNVETRVRPAR